jgi:hypothetical protein
MPTAPEGHGCTATIADDCSGTTMCRRNSPCPLHPKGMVARQQSPTTAAGQRSAGAVVTAYCNGRPLLQCSNRHLERQEAIIVWQQSPPGGAWRRPSWAMVDGRGKLGAPSTGAQGHRQVRHGTIGRRGLLPGRKGPRDRVATIDFGPGRHAALPVEVGSLPLPGTVTGRTASSPAGPELDPRWAPAKWATGPGCARPPSP